MREITYPAITVAVLENEEKPKRISKDEMRLRGARKVRFMNRRTSNFIVDSDSDMRGGQVKLVCMPWLLTCCCRVN